MTMGEYVYNMWNPIGVKWRFSIPLPLKILKSASLLGNAFIHNFLIDVFNRILQMRWKKVIDQEKLVPILNPRFDRGFFSYGMGDHVFDNSRLKDLGYEFQYPSFVNGYHQTVQWYKDHNWIPKAV